MSRNSRVIHGRIAIRMNSQELLEREPITRLFSAYGQLTDDQSTLSQAQDIARKLSPHELQVLQQAFRIQNKLGAESLQNANLLCQVAMSAIRQAV